MELIVAIGVTTLIATLATTVLHAMVQQQAAMGKQLIVGNSLTRLAARFRTDVQAAQQVAMDGSTIILVGEVTTITYSHPSPGTIRRTTESVGVTRRDHFDLQDHHEVLFDLESQASPGEIVSLTIRPPQQDVGAPTQPRYAIAYAGMTTLAELGRDYRWKGEAKGP